MQAFNRSRNKLLAGRVHLAESFSARLRGLIGAGLPQGTALLIRPCSAVHTWFMAYPIDLVFLDAGGRVLQILPSLPPFRFSPLVHGSKEVLELPAGCCRTSETAIGDYIEII